MTAGIFSRWRFALAPLLLASVMANLFLVGGVMGDRFAPPPNAAPAPAIAAAAEPARPRAGPLREVIAQLGEEERRIVTEAFQRRRQETRAARDRLTTARGRVREVMSADPVDPTALASALADIRAASSALQGVTHSALLDAAPRLGGETRRKLADSLRTP